MAKKTSYASRLYRGDISYDFISRRKIWYALSAAMLLISLLSLLFLRLHLGIEFKGGAVFDARANGHTISQAKEVFTKAGVTPEIVQTVGDGRLRIQTAAIDPSDPTKTTRLQQALATELGIGVNDVAVQQVGPSWGDQITKKALQGLIVFLALLFVMLSLRYEPKMGLAAFLALVHDIVITAGVYSLVGFEVSPATVIALLTILGYSLYDTVVVFDMVQENTKALVAGSRTTYSSAANHALNQTLVRSIKTSIIGLLPVASLLFIGAGLLQAGTLKDLALALFIGLLVGTYSSIFTATPILCDLKEREPAMKALARRVESRRRSEKAAGKAASPGLTGALALGASAGQSAGAARGGSANVGGSVLVDSGADWSEAPEEDNVSNDDAAGESAPRKTRGRSTPATTPSPQRTARKTAARGGRSGRPSGKRRR